MPPRWGMMIRGTPQARITNHRITKQGVKPVSEGPVSEGKAARVAGASVTYAAIRYRNAAKAARKRGETPLRDEVARARAGLLLSAAAAWHPLWLKWRASLGETHLPDAPIPAGANPLGGGVPGRQALRFRPEPREPVPHPGRRDAEGGGAAPQEGLYVNALEEDRGNRYGRRPSGVIRVPPTPGIPGLQSTP